MLVAIGAVFVELPKFEGGLKSMDSTLGSGTASDASDIGSTSVSVVVCFVHKIVHTGRGVDGLFGQGTEPLT